MRMSSPGANELQVPSFKSKGTYALILYLPRTRAITIGALGDLRFPRGVYIYIGSAMSGLDGRIARHLRHRDKKLFWHIDYILQYAHVLDVWACTGARRFECKWARAALALPNARVIAPRFGASDCRCPAHLIHLTTNL